MEKISTIANMIGGIDLANLEGRIKFQKSMYLLKEMSAITERFSYSWYIFGPYSSAVAKIGFEYINSKIDKEINAPNDFKEKVATFNLIKLEDNSSKWLELLASLHYLLKYKSYDKKRAFEELKKHQEYFNKEKIIEKAFLVIQKNFTI
jgi:uncharacterized protein YwgA